MGLDLISRRTESPGSDQAITLLGGATLKCLKYAAYIWNMLASWCLGKPGICDLFSPLAAGAANVCTLYLDVIFGEQVHNAFAQHQRFRASVGYAWTAIEVSCKTLQFAVKISVRSHHRLPKALFAASYPVTACDTRLLELATNCH